MKQKDPTKGTNLPDPKEIEKEINEFLANKYGNRIRVMGTQIGPWPGVEETEDGTNDQTGIRTVHRFVLT